MTPSLFDPHPGYARKGNRTQEAARDSLSREVLGSQARKVLMFIRSHGGATINEIHLATGVRESSVCARVKGLEDQGLIRKTDKTRLTSSNRKAIVWEAV